MKNTTQRRLFSLLLAFLLVLTLTPTALLAPPSGEGDGQDTEDTETPGDDQTPDTPDNPDTPSGDPMVNRMTIGGDENLQTITPDSAYALVLEPNSSANQGARLTVALDPDNAATQALHVIWRSSDSAIADAAEQDNGHVASVFGRAPGESTITISAAGKTCTVAVTVSGIQPGSSLTGGIEVQENQTVDLKPDVDFYLFGNAKNDAAVVTAAVVNNATNAVPRVNADNSITIEGRQEGRVTVVLTVSSAGRTYTLEIPVTITSNESVIEYKDGCSITDPLKFSVLESLIAAQCQQMTKDALASIIDLRVPTSEGVLYLGYKSPEDTGAGVGSSVTYYARSGARGPYISDITFVPNASFRGETSTISYTGRAANGRTFKGKIIVTLTEEKTDLTVSTKRDTPLLLSASLFSRACHEAVGSPLNYVIFTLPPANEGTLYVDYKNEYDYASPVSANNRYDQAALNNITFVPAQGFVGNVSISYAGYSVSGSKYTGELVIQVKQGLDDAITYTGSGAVTFSGSDFDAFCENATGRELSSVSFTPPPASQGVLYATPSGIRGNEVVSGQTFGYTALNRVTFIPADGFDGIVRIGFTGTARNGASFQGTVEIHIQSAGASRGDISYVCAAGQSVKLEVSDFASLCESVTGQRLHYISFQSLPDFNLGTLYHNRTSAGGMGTRVSTATRYFNSAVPYISNLSFWATQNFRGSVEIPFTGSAVNGQTFTGVMTISSGAGAGSGYSGAVTYTITGQNPARFVGSDFDNACRQATNEALSYVRFSLPASGQGILYYDYRSDVNPTALDTTRNLSLNGEVRIDRVAFVPARGFAGVVSVPYTGWSIRGQQFSGTVEITVHPAGALGGLVRYESGGAPVHFDAYSIQEAAGGIPVSLRFTGLPAANQGKLYYEYVSPTRYSWQGNTSTQYSLYGDPSVSNLTFVPRAGYYGEVNLPYTAANSDGTTYSGTIRVTVNQPSASANFNDLAGYSAQTKSAVDYLYAQGVVNGVGDGKYDPGASIRRSDFCLMLARAFQFNVGSTATGFHDVPAGAYYAQAVNQMYALGVVNGVGGGRFNPSSPVSRQDASLMVQRALQQAGIQIPDGNAAALAAYSDRGQVSGYAAGAVGGLVQRGLLPASNGQLAPKADLTRADMALLLHRAMTQ